jgi:hypothetical protein
VSGITPNALTIFDGQKLSALHKFQDLQCASRNRGVDNRLMPEGAFDGDAGTFGGPLAGQLNYGSIRHM